MTTEIVRAEPAGALMRMDPQALISQAIQSGAGIETMERLVALAKDMRAEMARDAWYEAMAQFQRECPSIRKTKEATIATRGGGSFKYRFAPLDEILSVIQPVMGPLGLSVSWKSKMEPGRVLVSCRVSHTLGHHEESGDIAMPIVDGDGGANPAQRVGIAATYAKRYSLLGIIGMAPEDDPDAKSQEPRQESQAERGPVAEGQGVGERAITEPQLKRLWAIARDSLWSQDDVHEYIKREHAFASSAAITMAAYNKVCDHVKMNPKKVPAA